MGRRPFSFVEGRVEHNDLLAAASMARIHAAVSKPLRICQKLRLVREVTP